VLEALKLVVIIGRESKLVLAFSIS
jgi:hypothetical protein